MFKIIESQLVENFAQLPAYMYFDQEIYAKEKELIFDAMPTYIGHELVVPNPGDYFTLQTEGHGRALVRTENGIQLMSNVCRHRQAVMLQGKGNIANIVCPLHRWTYNINGTLLGAPSFKETPCKELEKFPLQSWNGLLFEKNHHIIKDNVKNIKIDEFDEIDFSQYTFDRIETFECNYNWKTFLEFYLEDYHVEPYHPGLGNFVTCSDLKWHFDKWFSIQTVGIKDGLQNPGDSEIYREWHQAVINYYGKNLPKYGAMWVYIYPNIMIEWYPMVLVISTIIPDGPEKTINQVEFFHPEDIMHFDKQYISGARAGANAYLETAIEDNEIGEKMQAGRKALWKRGATEIGPYQSPLEDGMEHFHKLYREQFGIALV
jgi:phenylpropionate dioxygenase-like ring-hydroxylating dioxygenase large terminal subunit